MLRRRFGRFLMPSAPPPSDEAAAALRALAAARPAPERLPPERAEALFARALATSAETPIRQRRGRAFGSRPRQAFAWASAAVAACLVIIVAVAFRPPLPRPDRTVSVATSPKIAAQPKTAATPPGPPFAAPTRAHTLPAPRRSRRLATRPRGRNALRQFVVAAAEPPVLSRPARGRQAGRLSVTARPLRDVAAAPVLAAAVAPPVSLPPAPRAALLLLREGEMIVRVTQGDGPPPSPVVIVRDAPASAPGFAQAAALRPGADRQPVWTRCTISSEQATPDIVLVAAAPAPASTSSQTE